MYVLYVMPLCMVISRYMMHQEAMAQQPQTLPLWVRYQQQPPQAPPPSLAGPGGALADWGSWGLDGLVVGIDICLWLWQWDPAIHHESLGWGLQLVPAGAPAYYPGGQPSHKSLSLHSESSDDSSSSSSLVAVMVWGVCAVGHVWWWGNVGHRFLFFDGDGCESYQGWVWKNCCTIALFGGAMVG